MGACCGGMKTGHKSLPEQQKSPKKANNEQPQEAAAVEATPNCTEPSPPFREDQSETATPASNHHQPNGGSGDAKEGHIIPLEQATLAIESNASPDSWFVSTATPAFASGTIATRETYPGSPPVCATSFCPR